MKEELEKLFNIDSMEDMTCVLDLFVSIYNSSISIILYCFGKKNKIKNTINTYFPLLLLRK